MEIRKIVDAIQAGRIRISDHADEEAAADRLTIDQICFSVLHGEIIEDYPTDKPFPSCLILGETPRGELVHSIWAYNEGSRRAVLVTVYRPDPNRWINWRTRRRR